MSTALIICHLVPALPLSPGSALARDIAGLRALGHSVVPIAVTAGAVPARGTVRPALTAAAANPAGLAAAAGFAQRHRGLPRRALLRAAAHVAALARGCGADHIHAATAATAAIAICAARIAGITASVIYPVEAATCADAPDDDLAHTLAAADLVVGDGAMLAQAVCARPAPGRT